LIEHTERAIHRRADLTLGIRANENPRKDNYFVTAKDQSEFQLISGTKHNKKRPGRWFRVVDLSKTD